MNGRGKSLRIENRILLFLKGEKMYKKKERGKMLGVVSTMLLFGLLACPVLAVDILIPGDTSVGSWDSLNRIYTLTGPVTGYRLNITEDDLTLNGAGNTITGDGSTDGVYVYGRTNVVVTGLNVTGCTRGIGMWDAQSNTVAGNNVYGNSLYGVYIASSASSNNNIVENNSVTSNNSHGIYLNTNCSNNILTGNIVDLNGGWGIMINYNCNDNDLIRNTISNNSTGGINMYQSGGIEIYSNSFINHSTQIAGSAAYDITYNFDAPIGGNYWSDYTGPDNNGDGFIDIPRTDLPGGVDNLPLVSPYSEHLVTLIGNTIAFFDDCRDAGTISARGRDPNIRLDEFRGILDAAKAQVVLGEYALACEDLDEALEACDGIKRDLIIGVGANGAEDLNMLIGMMEDVKTALGC
jgi:parallel beta-helix repeat protein